MKNIKRKNQKEKDYTYIYLSAKIHVNKMNLLAKTRKIRKLNHIYIRKKIEKEYATIIKKENNISFQTYHEIKRENKEFFENYDIDYKTSFEKIFTRYLKTFVILTNNKRDFLIKKTRNEENNIKYYKIEHAFTNKIRDIINQATTNQKIELYKIFEKQNDVPLKTIIKIIESQNTEDLANDVPF